MQNAEASYQLTQSMGRFSCVPGDGVHVAAPISVADPVDGWTCEHARSTLDGATWALSVVTQPAS
jgi:hypothetical protein